MKSIMVALYCLFFATSKTRRAIRARPATPTLEGLEDRTVPQATPATDPFLFTPLPETTLLAEHIHQHLTIIINGRQHKLSGVIGNRLPDGFLPIHTHDATGIIHVESPVRRPFFLGDFFAIWGQTFNNHQIMDQTVDSGHTLRMTVNGRITHRFDTWALHAHDDILIVYGRKGAPLPVFPPFKFPLGL